MEKNMPDDFDYSSLDADKVLSSYGKYGRYQMLAYAITNAVWFIYATEMMIMAFITQAPSSFHCVTSTSDNQSSTPVEQKQQCHITNNSSNADNGSLLLECGRVEGTKLSYSQSFGQTLPTEFDLVCSRAHLVHLGSSIFMFGSMAFTPVISQMSDRYGRRWPFLASVWLAVGSNLLATIAPTYTIFLICRLFAGIGSSGLSLIGWVLSCESVSVQFRGVIPLAANLTWVFGYLLVGVFAQWIKNWRLLYLILTAPTILCLSFYWLLPESLHWLVIMKKGDMIKRYIERANRMNKRQIQRLDQCVALSSATDDQKVVHKRSIIDVFKSPVLIVFMLLHSFICAVNNMYYWGLSLFSVDLSEDRITGYILSGLVEIPAGIMAIPLLQWFSRKGLSVVALTAQGLAMICCALFTQTPWLALLLPLIGKAANIIVWSSVPLLLPEMIPTTVRNVFYGAVSFIGKFGSILAPYMGILKSINPLMPPLLLGIFSLVSAGFICIFPETKGKPLPEDMNDIDAGILMRGCYKKKLVATKLDIQQNNDHTKPTSCVHQLSHTDLSL